MSETWEERLIDEKNELQDKVEKLELFLDSPACVAIDRKDRDLLLNQLFTMYHYLHILNQRVDRISTK
jgi:hypothetical protein